MLYKNFGAPELQWVDFFVGASYGAAAVCAALGLGALLYFRARIGTAS